VGLGEAEARQAGHRVRVAKIPMTRVARAVETGQTRGFMKAVVEVDSQRILGAAILGVDGGEVATVIQVAMMGGLPWTALRDGVFSHPTTGESLNNLFAELGSG
jgi:pyruvate/2-oxoglutarate dehydrogenase complex dihydrolipoamide dehydrogenase (E3) component